MMESKIDIVWPSQSLHKYSNSTHFVCRNKTQTTSNWHVSRRRCLKLHPKSSDRQYVYVDRGRSFGEHSVV